MFIIQKTKFLLYVHTRINLEFFIHSHFLFNISLKYKITLETNQNLHRLKRYINHKYLIKSKTIKITKA